MSLKKTPLKDLLTHTKTKEQLTEYFAKGVVQEYDGNKDCKVIVTYDTTITVNKPHLLAAGFRNHKHEEADTQIPLHVLHSIKESTYKHIDVISPDTDVLILLMDLVSRGDLGPLTSLVLKAGKGKQTKAIDAVERVNCIGRAKSQ